MKTRLVAATLGCLIAVGLTLAWLHWTGDDLKRYTHPPAKDHTALAYRINHACKPGYYVVDWSAGDEWRPMPGGVISVTCGAKDEDNYRVYTVAVAR